MAEGEALDRPSLLMNERLSLVAGMLQRFTWERAQTNPTHARIELGGRITIDDAAALWKRISETLNQVQGLEQFDVELSNVLLIDGACMALLVQFRSDLRGRRVRCEFLG